MSLNLDTRQRAMLAEMGVRVWSPVQPSAPEQALAKPAPQAAIERASAAATPEPERPMSVQAFEPPRRVAPVVAQTLPPATAAPSQVLPLPDGIAAMDWSALRHCVHHCQACAMCLGRRAPVLVAPQQNTACDWLLVGDPPDEAQERAGQPFVEEAGQLLDNMLRAVGVSRWSQDTDAGEAQTAASRAYLTHVLKCRPALIRAPNTTELDTCAHFLRREIALTQPKVILAMGRFAMQLLLSETPPEQASLPLGKLRGQVWRFAGVPLVVTYPPGYLLRNGQDKARAWADLCLARAVATGAMASP